MSGSCVPSSASSAVSGWAFAMQTTDKLDEKDTAAMARDLERCDVMAAIGSKTMRRAANRHRKVCFEALRSANKAEGLDRGQGDLELLSELGV